MGGAWNYCQLPSSAVDIPQTNPHQPSEEPLWSGSDKHGKDCPVFATPMYDELETNIPKSIMGYSEFFFSEQNQLFPERQTVMDYLEEYASDVISFVHFEKQVKDVKLVETENQNDSWLLEYQDIRSKENFESLYDAIVVCNGHYTVPYIPDIPGIKEWNEFYSASISHSKFYRNPTPYANKKVLVVGSNASGSDISNHICTVSKHPLLVSKRSKVISYFHMEETAQKTEVPEIAEFLPPSLDRTRAVRFIDGRIEDDIDSILFCTGYLYSYPFISALQPPLITDGFRVRNTFQHIFNFYHPSLAFLGLPMKVLPLPLCEAQAAVVARVWSGRLQLPAPHEMEAWETQRVQERGDGKEFHSMGHPEDFDYENDLWDWVATAASMKGQKMARRWTKEEYWLRERLPLVKQAFAQMGEKRHTIRSSEELGFDYQKWLAEQEDQKNGEE